MSRLIRLILMMAVLALLVVVPVMAQDSGTTINFYRDC